jgi:hypothetical protein
LILDVLSRCCAEVEARHFVREPRSFVYFLVDETEVVYVGSTSHLDFRIASHLRRPPGPFTRVFWREVPLGTALETEGALIRALRPRFNLTAPRYRGDDNRVLVTFGLAPHLDERANAEEWRRHVRLSPSGVRRARSARRGHANAVRPAAAARA